MDLLWYVMIVFAIAGMIKGTIGLGLPAVSMGLMSLVMAPVQAAALLIIPSMITNIWQLFAEGEVWRLIKRFWTLLLGIVVGSIWSIFPTLAKSEFQAEALLGVMLAIYGIYGLCAQQMPNLSTREKYLSPIVGYLGGALTVATGVVVIPVVPYLQALHLKRDDLVQALGLAFTTSTLCLAGFLAMNSQTIGDFNYSWSFLALVPALVGMWLGKKIRSAISEQRFRQVFFCGLIVFGSYMALH